MFVALDKNGKRVDIEDAVKEEKYYCPCCGTEMIQKKGTINVWHYAHKSLANCDSWYEMSEWHKGWQGRFPERFREVVVERDGKKHIADIKMGNLILELQHSSISTDTFIERSKFYGDCGHIVWLFDFRDDFDRMDIVYDIDKYKNLICKVSWSNPKRFLDYIDCLDDFTLEDVTIFIELPGNLFIKILKMNSGLSNFKGRIYNKKQFINHIHWRCKEVTPETLLHKENGICRVYGI